MNAAGQVYVIECNPLPGLTPDYSDLVLISKAAGIDYKTLIGEILAGGLKRFREKRRNEAEKAAERAAEERQLQLSLVKNTESKNGSSGEKRPTPGAGQE
jgi:D-alanine-D-alanine ligase